MVDRDAGRLDAAVSGFAPGAGRVITLVGDVGSEATVAEHIGTILDRFSRFDILGAAAGSSNGTAVPDTPLDEWEFILRTNLTGAFLRCRGAIPEMRRSGGGAIVLVGLQLAFAGGRANAAYLASKGAVVSLARSMAVDHAGERIRVNVVVPGAIDTPLLSRAFDRAADFRRSSPALDCSPPDWPPWPP